MKAVLGLPPAEACEHRVLAFLHDLGALGCPDELALRNELIRRLNSLPVDAERPLIRVRGFEPPFHGPSDSPGPVVQRAQIGAIVRGFREQIEAHLHDVPRARIPVEPRLPLWDGEAGRLWWGDRVMRKVRIRRSGNVRAILDAFEAAGWPAQMDTPHPLDQKSAIEVSTALHDLNDSLFEGSTEPKPIRFQKDKERIGWVRLT